MYNVIIIIIIKLQSVTHECLYKLMAIHVLVVAVNHSGTLTPSTE